MQTANRATPDTTQAGLKGSATRPAAQAPPAATPDPEPSGAALPTNPRLTLKAAVRWSRGKPVAKTPARLMEGRNPRTGARIVGTAEEISATSSVQFDAFTRGEDGRLEYEHTGLTEIHYKGRRPGGARPAQDSQHTIADEEHGILFVDENLETVYEDEIELVAATGGFKPPTWERA